MKKIFIHFNNLDGCALHRLILPYKEIAKQTDLFDITFGYSEEDDTVEKRIAKIAQHDIFVFHRILPEGLLDAIRKANPNIKVIIDIDDNWRLNDTHPSATVYKKENGSERILEHIKKADYVTCTNEFLASLISQHNKNVYIFNNALNREDQFVPYDIPSERIRFGLIGGASHFKDYELLDGVVKQLPKDILDKIQFVLCGFDKGTYRIYENDKVKVMDMPYEDNGWHKMEVMLTDNYSTIQPDHRDFLLEHKYKINYQTDEAYHRIWAKDIFNYATMFDEIDVLLVPLLGNDFTKYKSELKMIEASAKGKPVIVSDVAPYNNSCAIGAIERGGAINKLGNCLLINNNKGSKAWVKAITRLVKDEELRKMLSNNISNLINLPQYNLTEVAKKRIEFLKSI